jgi:hypothetical protein
MAQLTQDPIGLTDTDEPQAEAQTETVERNADDELFAKLDAAEDDLLSRLDAAEDDVGVMAEELEGDDPIGEGVEDPEPQEEDTPSDQEEDREQPEPIKSDEIEKALAALRRDGLPPKVIEQMTNQEVLDLGLKRSKVQADTDNAYRELQELKKTGEDTAESDQESEPSEPTDQPMSANLKEAVKPFQDLFGEDGAKALEGYQKAVLMPMINKLDHVIQVIGQYTAKEARRELGDKYPQLGDDQAYSKVEERMGKLLKSGAYSSAHELMADAARLEFADDQRDAAKAYRDKVGQMRENGQMSSQSKQSAPASLSQEDREDLVLDLLEGGGSKDEARRAYDG